MGFTVIRVEDGRLGNVDTVEEPGVGGDEGLEVSN
jgi:hypothetical protein